MIRAGISFAALLLSACSSSVPTYGPSMLVLPGTGKTFDHFRLDEQDCRTHAQSQIAKSPDQDSAGTPQQRYDRAFLQCMYAKGHKVPLTGRASDYIDSTTAARTSAPTPAPQRAAPPPPPAGQPPAEAPPDFRPK